jgi:hypothetical protein
MLFVYNLVGNQLICDSVFFVHTSRIWVPLVVRIKIRGQPRIIIVRVPDADNIN